MRDLRGDTHTDTNTRFVFFFLVMYQLWVIFSANNGRRSPSVTLVLSELLSHLTTVMLVNAEARHL